MRLISTPLIKMRLIAVQLLGVIVLAGAGFSASADDLEIERASWRDSDQELRVTGKDAEKREQLTLTAKDDDRILGTTSADSEGEWEFRVTGLSYVPCKVRVETDEKDDEKRVKNAPENCGPGEIPGDSGGEIGEHENLVYNGPGTCLECHNEEAHDILGSTHYQWKGIAPDMVNQPGILQGKDAGAVNTYCGNITGNWNGCSSCHIGKGAEPEAVSSRQQLENIDCLICHQEEYKRKKVDGAMVPDTDNMAISIDEAVRTVHNPTRVTCLGCHAKAGGGDAVKRGDLALATGNTSDSHYDVHMATTGADLACQDCHTPENHRFPGKGSDIRPTDLDKPLECANSGCHNSTPHDSRELNKHTERVACQSCHIPIYAKDADDSIASEATEIDRNWTAGSHSENPPFHPVLTKANDLVPVYRHWNRASDNYLLGDVIFPNPYTGTYQTSIPQGAVDDSASKIYPFKYKISNYPLRTESNQLIALDTSVFFATADADAAAMSGLENMGFDPSDDVTWVTTDTYQLLNHQVSPEDEALDCNACHLNSARMDLQGKLGYAPINKDQATCSSGCHDAKDAFEWNIGNGNLNDFKEYHDEHSEEGVACSDCHGFSRN